MGNIDGARVRLSVRMLAAFVIMLPVTVNAQGAGPAASKPKSVCITNHLIDHTEVIDKNTILFHMIGKTVWKNSLTAPCHTLTRQEGFAYQAKTDQLCSNLESIRVIRTGEVCLLGEFTPYTPPAK